MDEETSDIMNLDLNLGPAPEAGSVSLPSEPVNLDDWIDNPVERIREVVNDRIEIIREAVAEPIERIREAVRIRARQRRRWRQVQIPHETQTLSVELNQLIENSGNVSTLQTGEGSVAAEERTNEVPKMCENNSGFLEDEVSEKKSDVEKGTANDGSFFDCNICLDLATDPVVTCCGHLFCWPCLYQWLHVHSDAKECPVCKGEVTTKNVTPIYGRGSNTRQPEEDPSLEVPLRPQARRVESLRQTIQRSSFSFPVEEMIRRLGSRFHESNGTREMADRTNSFLNRIMTYRGMRAEQNPITPPDDMVDLTQNGMTNPEAGPARRLESLLLRRSQAQSQRSSNHSSFSPALSPAGRLVDADFRNHPVGRNQEQPQPVDDRDSFSSIAAVINSESQMDTAVEIDSMVSLSTSSSRRRHDALRISDVDSGDSRAPRRRRLD
uniref:E3 ubiquitin-protein ligase RMA n=1 Tax=Rhizophora mucronata TaxID=61149 RepID=A0A2P2KQY3_RHIMU